MYQGETVNVIISGFPVDVQDIATLRVSYMMQKTILLSLNESDCVFDEDEQTVSFTLTQEQSLSIKSGTVARHVVVVTRDGVRFESRIDDELVKYTSVTEVL